VKSYVPVYVQAHNEDEHGSVEMLVGVQMGFTVNKNDVSGSNKKREIWSSCF
jgi:hypothetical protein